ncbi:MAG: hypothetical protein V7691_15470 [Galbibacter orientalis]|uniref:hypothetical protein n=1 Tax=Galbibacter orientalis TaxID=453852 RepID=UPI003001599C
MNNRKKLKEQNKFLLKIAESIIRAGNSSAYSLDFFILSIINRAISLNKAFILLLKNKNSLTAISIVRLQLDNAIRLNSINVVDNKDDFLEHFFEGKPINKYKIGKQPLSDKFLVKELDKDTPGALDLYNYLCDFIHFSDKYFQATKTSPKKEEAIFRIIIGEFNVLNENEKNAFYENMISISKTFIRISKDWIDSKNSMLYKNTAANFNVS